MVNAGTVAFSGRLLQALGRSAFDLPLAVLDVYLRQCSIKVTAVALAMMGVTLANVGTNPVTGREIFGVDAVRDTLSVMFTCGIYNAAGEWSCRVGLLAKSGLGGIVAVVNRQLGNGVFFYRGWTRLAIRCAGGFAASASPKISACTRSTAPILDRSVPIRLAPTTAKSGAANPNHKDFCIYTPLRSEPENSRAR